MKKLLISAWVMGLALPFLPIPLGAQGTLAPIWVNVLPQEPGKVYAVGAASLGDNAAAALKQASQNARLEVATRLKSSVKGETSLNSQMTVHQTLGQAPSASSRQQVSQDSRTTTLLTELTGLEIAETWADAPGKTLYALACLDVGAAMETLRNRAQAMEPGLKGVGGNIKGPREAARAVFRLRAARVEAAQLEPLSKPLVDFTGDAAFYPLLRTLQADIERRVAWLRGFLTLGVDAPAAFPADLLAVFRLSAQEKGFGWAEASPELRLRVELATPGGKPGLPRPWWTVDRSDFITAKAALHLSLADVDGKPLGSADLEAAGLGTAPVSASQALMKDLRKKVDGVLDQWLSDLAL